jgi:hypothetical protein
MVCLSKKPSRSPCGSQLTTFVLVELPIQGLMPSWNRIDFRRAFTLCSILLQGFLFLLVGMSAQHSINLSFI